MESAKKRNFAIVFRCAEPKCTYVSKRYYNLKRHVKVHNKGRWRSKRFPCPCCAYAGCTRAHLRRHVGNKHPTVELTKNDLIGLAYEDFDEPEMQEVEAHSDQNENEAERTHLRRHMSNNSQESKNDLISLAYEMQDEYEVDLDLDLEINQEQLKFGVKQEEFQLEEVNEEEEEDKKSMQVLVNGPVTVLQMVTPPRPGEMYSQFALEGEAFRLIPVEMLPEDIPTQDL